MDMKGQVVSIGFGCEKEGIVLHELMHTVGFFHTNSRPDRDAYVIVYSKNIRPGKLQLAPRLSFHSFMDGKRERLWEQDWLSPNNRDCFAFVSLCSVIGPENSRFLLDQSDSRIKPLAPWSQVFSHASVNLLVFYLFSPEVLLSYWLVVIFSFTLIGFCVYFGFGFTTFNPKISIL